MRRAVARDTRTRPRVSRRGGRRPQAPLSLRARAAITVLDDPRYRRLWVSGLCVAVVRWMELVTLGWLALQLTGSPFMVAVAAFARSAPLMVIGPFAGIVSDRVSRGHLLLGTQAAGAATSIVLAVLFGTGAGGYGSLVALELVFGILWALDFPARRTALFSMLGATRVAQAVSLETVSMQIAKVGGPLLAGMVLARLGPAACYAIMAALYLGGAGVSAGLWRAIGGPVARGRTSVTATLGEGLRIAWTSPIVRAVLLITIAMNSLFFPYQHMLAVFAQDVLGGGPRTLGALVAAEGVGALAGALAIAAQRGRLSHARLFGGGVLVAPFLLAAFSMSSWLGACLVLLVVIGLAESAFAAMQSTLVLLGAPAHARGGTMGILSACIGTQPLGTLAIGALAGTIGVASTFTVNAIVSLAVIVPLAVPLMRRREP